MIVGISSQIRYPKIIAKTNAKYLSGVTRETSEYLYDWLNHKFATPPKIPIKDNKTRWLRLGITQPCAMVVKFSKVIDNENKRKSTKQALLMTTVLWLLPHKES